jgi:hypothetical protein
MLVCWRDNCNDWPVGFRVLQLADVVAAKKLQGMFVSLDEGYPAPWSEDSFFAAAERDGTSAHDMALARSIIAMAQERRWGPIWLVNPKPVFAVGTPQFFKIDSRGRVGFPFFRLRAGSAFDELAERLNRVVPALRVEPDDVGTKRKGAQLSELFNSAE